MFETQIASLKCQKTLDKLDIWLPVYVKEGTYLV